MVEPIGGKFPCRLTPAIYRPAPWLCSKAVTHQEHQSLCGDRGRTYGSLKGSPEKTAAMDAEHSRMQAWRWNITSETYQDVTGNLEALLSF
jgi:hypothetical protein